MPQLPLGFLFPPISEVVRFGGQDFTKKIRKRGRTGRKQEGKKARHNCCLLQILWFELILEIAFPIAFEI